MPVRAVRGATTVTENNSEEILRETKHMLEQIIRRNNIDKSDIISAFFTMTDDLNSIYPAVAARELGWTESALMCANELNIEGSLRKCIRVMVHINTEKRSSDICHVYLRGAETLRPDLHKKISIAIDGPAGAGKSTIAKAVSKHFGIIYLDTGAMYRAVAYKAIQQGIDTKDAEGLAALIKAIDLNIQYVDGEQRIFVDGEDVTPKIRTPEVTIGSSNVAVIPDVRLKMVELQRKIAKADNVVMDGRDIGTYVLPDASVKIFLTASSEERAVRRYNEQLEKGLKGITLEEVRKDLEYRDMNDSTRAFAPLSKAQDAIEVNTTGFEVEDSIKRIISIIEGKLKWK